MFQVTERSNWFPSLNPFTQSHFLLLVKELPSGQDHFQLFTPYIFTEGRTLRLHVSQGLLGAKQMTQTQKYIVFLLPLFFMK